jgi:hypothetical protein
MEPRQNMNNENPRSSGGNKNSHNTQKTNNNTNDRRDEAYFPKRDSKNFEKPLYNKNGNFNRNDGEESYQRNYSNNNGIFNKPFFSKDSNFNRGDRQEPHSNSNNNRNFERPLYNKNTNYNRRDREESESNSNNQNLNKYPGKNFQQFDRDNKQDQEDVNKNYHKLNTRTEKPFYSKKDFKATSELKNEENANSSQNKKESDSFNMEKMNYEILEKLKCSICYEFINKPMECQNCNNIFCFSCVMVDERQCRFSTCPLCRSQANFQNSVFALRLINSIPIECPNKCGKNTTKGDLEKHLAGCKNKLISCVLCNKEDIKSNFLQHLINDHEDSLLMKYDKNSDKNILKNS